MTTALKKTVTLAALRGDKMIHFIERLWRSLKYEAIYLNGMTDGFKARRVITEWLDFYNTIRPHSSLDGRTPHEVINRHAFTGGVNSVCEG